LVAASAQQMWNEIIVGAKVGAQSGAQSAAPSSSPSGAAEAEGPKNFALVATGGFGRGWLFPHSDIDLLFLHNGGNSESEFKDPIRSFSQELWDLRLKLSPATRS